MQVVPEAGATETPAADGEYDVEAINREFAVVLTGSRGMILKISATGPIHDRVRIMRPDAFRLWLQNRFTQVVGSNGEPRWKTWAAAWLADKHRREYAGIEFFPNPDGPPERQTTSTFGRDLILNRRRRAPMPFSRITCRPTSAAGTPASLNICSHGLHISSSGPAKGSAPPSCCAVRKAPARLKSAR